MPRECASKECREETHGLLSPCKLEKLSWLQSDEQVANVRLSRDRTNALSPVPFLFRHHVDSATESQSVYGNPTMLVSRRYRLMLTPTAKKQ